MIAALFVLPDGPYANRDGVDPWDEARDARKYAGPWPVVAHPPCARWGNLWWAAQNARGPSAPGLGEDGGCFESALASVRRWGGVLEHPEGTRAYARFGIRAPKFGRGWQEHDEHPAGIAWVCSVDQANYGHRARKRTWLYFVGQTRPAELTWSPGKPTALVVSGPGFLTPEERAARGRPLLSKREHQLTPPLFRDLLLALAAAAKAPGCEGSRLPPG